MFSYFLRLFFRPYDAMQVYVSGVSDLILLVGRKGFNSLCIEMKNKTSQTLNQKCWQLEAERNGNKYVVCKSFEEFRMVIEEYLN